MTYGVGQERESSSASWGDADNDAHVGASGKFGITSGVTLDATVNPDFSQVESDAFQIQVNQRFPIFFSEKRPVLHGRHGPLQHRARQQHAHRGPHPPHHRSDLRRQADGHARQDHLRRAERARRSTRATSAIAATSSPIATSCSRSAARRMRCGAPTTSAGSSRRPTHEGRNNFATGADFIVRPSSPQSVAGMFLTTRTQRRHDRHAAATPRS